MGTYRKRFNEKARSGHMAKLKELKELGISSSLDRMKTMKE